MPLGYAFNLDGSSIYFTMAIAFIAQALNIPLSWGDYLLILAVLLLTSKGAATVTGGGFITLAATLATMNGKVPVAGMVLILGIDRFMSEARAITNLFGNTVATIVRGVVGRHAGYEAGSGVAGSARRSGKRRAGRVGSRRRLPYNDSLVEQAMSVMVVAMAQQAVHGPEGGIVHQPRRAVFKPSACRHGAPTLRSGHAPFWRGAQP